MERACEKKAKIIYRTDSPDRVLMKFKDSATAFDGLKKRTEGGLCGAS